MKRQVQLKTDGFFPHRCRVVHDLIEMTTYSPETQTAKAVEPPKISEAAEVLLTGRHRKKKDLEEKSLMDIEVNFQTRCSIVKVAILSSFQFFPVFIFVYIIQQMNE